MRLKTFSAASMTEALKIVKEHFGEEAIIVSSKKADNGSGVCVTAAIDKDEPVSYTHLTLPTIYSV